MCSKVQCQLCARGNTFFQYFWVYVSDMPYEYTYFPLRLWTINLCIVQVFMYWRACWQFGIRMPMKLSKCLCGKLCYIHAWLVQIFTCCVAISILAAKNPPNLSHQFCDKAHAKQGSERKRSWLHTRTFTSSQNATQGTGIEQDIGNVACT